MNPKIGTTRWRAGANPPLGGVWQRGPRPRLARATSLAQPCLKGRILMHDDKRDGWNIPSQRFTRASDGPEGTLTPDAEAELDAARNEAAEQRDKYLRLRADMENFKRRVERQYADQAKAAKKHLL